MKLIDILVEELPKRGGWPVGADYVVQDNDGSLDVKFGAGEATLEHDQRGVWVNNITPDWGIDTDESYIRDFKILAGDASTDIITREQYEAALAAKNEGWIEWDGGNYPPVSTSTVVDVKFKDGQVQSGYPAGEYSWEHAWQGSNIIAYRLHQPQQEEQPEASEEDLNECIGQDAAPVWNGEGLPPVGCECEVSVDGGRSWCTYKAINEKNGARLIEIGNFTEEFQNNNWIFRPICSEAEKKRDEAVKTIMLTGWCQTAAEEIYDLVAAGKVPGMKLED